jgi:DNA mismatch endonuclease (patch repair protein)
MRGNRGRDTQPELRVRRLVHASGLRYRVDTRPVPTLRFRADLVFTRARVAVFIDGCFWHGCPEHYRSAQKNARFWSKKVRENAARDERVTSTLKDAGWEVIRAWEHENPQAVADHIVRVVRARRVDGKASKSST